MTLAARIETLLDTPSAVEIVRDQITAILKVEVEAQIQLAQDASQDTRPFRIRVFSERSSCWEQYRDEMDRGDPDAVPMVNVWLDSWTSSGGNFYQQKLTATYHLDVFGVGISRELDADVVSGDQEAAFEVQRASGKVRAIITAAPWSNLGLDGTVSRRIVSEAQFFQPKSGERVTQNVLAARMKLEVDLVELNPEAALQILEGINLTVRRESNTGEVLLVAKYP